VEIPSSFNQVVLANGALVGTELVQLAELTDQFVDPSVDGSPVLGDISVVRSKRDGSVAIGNGLEILPHVFDHVTKVIDWQDGSNADGVFMQGAGALFELQKPVFDIFSGNPLPDRVRDKENAMGVEDAVSRPPRRENGQRPFPISGRREDASGLRAAAIEEAFCKA